jgi:hypothetical protein
MLLTMKGMPRERFLAAVSRSVELTDGEKRVIQRDVPRFDSVYPYCGLTRYLQDGKLFMAIDQFAWPKVPVEYPPGHVIFMQGSGSLDTYVHRNGLWVLVESGNYD